MCVLVQTVTYTEAGVTALEHCKNNIWHIARRISFAQASTLLIPWKKKQLFWRMLCKLLQFRNNWEEIELWNIKTKSHSCLCRQEVRRQLPNLIRNFWREFNSAWVNATSRWRDFRRWKWEFTFHYTSRAINRDSQQEESGIETQVLVWTCLRKFAPILFKQQAGTASRSDVYKRFP